MRAPDTDLLQLGLFDAPPRQPGEFRPGDQVTSSTYFAGRVGRVVCTREAFGGPVVMVDYGIGAQYPHLPTALSLIAEAG